MHTGLKKRLHNEQGSMMVIALLVLGMPFALVVMGPISGAPDFDVAGSAMWGRESRHVFPSHWRRFPHGHDGELQGYPQSGSTAAVRESPHWAP